MKKLHLGCGGKKRKGWINIDINENVKPDVITDAKDLHMFETNSVDIIECCHLLEHLQFGEAVGALKEWFRVLKKGGKLLIELPNFQRCIEILYNDEGEEAKRFAMIGIYGGGYEPANKIISSIFQLHKSGWSPDTLSEELTKIGFKEIVQKPVTQTWRKATKFNRDMRIECLK